MGLQCLSDYRGEIRATEKGTPMREGEIRATEKGTPMREGLALGPASTDVTPFARGSESRRRTSLPLA